MQIARPLIEFTLFSKFLVEHLEEPSALTQTWMQDFKTSVVGGVKYDTLVKFASNFLNWEKSMESERNSRKFSPMVLDKRSDVFGLVKGVTPKKVYSRGTAKNWALFESYLNEDKAKRAGNNHAATDAGRFMAQLLWATQKVAGDKIQI